MVIVWLKWKLKLNVSEAATWRSRKRHCWQTCASSTGTSSGARQQTGHWRQRKPAMNVLLACKQYQADTGRLVWDNYGYRALIFRFICSTANLKSSTCRLSGCVLCYVFHMCCVLCIDTLITCLYFSLHIGNYIILHHVLYSICTIVRLSHSLLKAWVWEKDIQGWQRTNGMCRSSATRSNMQHFLTWQSYIIVVVVCTMYNYLLSIVFDCLMARVSE